MFKVRHLIVMASLLLANSAAMAQDSVAELTEQLKKADVETIRSATLELTLRKTGPPRRGWSWRSSIRRSP